MAQDFVQMQKEAKKRNRKQAIRIFFGRGIIVKISVAIAALFIFLAVFADFVAPYDPNAQNLVLKLQAPSMEHLFGTDYLGRDVLSRLIFGCRISMIVSLLAGTVAAIVGIVLGLIAGYTNGIVSRIIMGVTDVILSMPGMVFTLIIASALGKSVVSLTLAIGIGIAPTYVRMVNGLTLSLKQNDYVVASQLVGQNNKNILFSHLLPNAFPSLIVLYTINLGQAIMTESSMSYLGVGISPPTATWGNMVNDAYTYLMQAPRLAIIPGVCIIILIIAFNIIGDGLRDALDPRLRGKL